MHIDLRGSQALMPSSVTQTYQLLARRLAFIMTTGLGHGMQARDRDNEEWWSWVMVECRLSPLFLFYFFKRRTVSESSIIA
jgi:hypothetical protein